MKKLSGVLALLVTLPLAAHAISPGPHAREDAKRFGFNRVQPILRHAPSAANARAFAGFNATQGGSWKLRYSPRTGLPAAVVGGHDYPRPGRPEDAARAFLSAHTDVFGFDPTGLSVEKQNAIPGHRHLLFRQNYKGIPVEGAAVKVHLDDHNSVVGVHSTFEPGIALPTNPAVPADAAGRAALADAGGRGSVRGTPTLVVLPLESDGLSHLAWKMRVDTTAGSWRYFVDALTGQVLFRYSTDRFIGPCLSSGVVTGMVWDIDPVQSPGPYPKGFNNQYVYQPNGSGGVTQTVTQHDSTYGDGFFCASQFDKVSMSLQGPYVSVSEFRGPNAHYDNGGGVWHTVSTPVSSPHPYPNSAVIGSTINLTVAAPNAVEFLPVFQNFSVGGFGGGAGEGSGDINDDDQLFIYDQYNHPIASYIGNRGPFNGASVHGQIMHLALRSNDGGQNNGYDIAISSYLVLTTAGSDGAPLSSHTWVAADQPQGLHGEMSLFYHINKMHDYFLNDVDKSSAAPISAPVTVMAHVGPDLLNAFYDPDYDDLYFGDINSNSPSDVFMDDATVPHHEYTHYVVEKIWPIQNYGQAGTISEANADYWSASSLDDPNIGTYVVGFLGGSGSLRNLDCATNPPCYILGNPATGWNGEIHDDSPFVSQSLWDIRKNRIAALGHDVGRSCSDGLVFQALLFFPESFSELYEAMLQVDKLGSVAACGGANNVQAVISSAFGAHGLIPAGGDAYEPNDGFETATDISSIPAVTATLYPVADQDFYSFGAGPGLVQITLNLPSSGSGLFKAYQLKLFNASRQQVAGAAPPYNGFGTIDGICDQGDCNTTQGTVTLQYNNPTGGLLYAEVVGGDALNGSNSGVNSVVPYSMTVSYPKGGALAGSIVTAKFDRDTIAFNVATSTFVRNQDWRFAYAQLRDQGMQPIPNTVTHVPSIFGDYLLFRSSQNAGGLMTGTVQLSTTSSFGSRFPAFGTIYLEVFGFDLLQGSSSTASSMGLSNPLNLSANATELTAYNNLFNPALGQKATIKYAISGPGHLTVKLYTATNRYIVTLFDGDAPAGKGSVDWAGRNANGSPVASGAYVVKAVGPGLNNTQMIVVIH